MVSTLAWHKVTSIGGITYPNRISLRGYDSSDFSGGVTQEQIRAGVPVPDAAELVDNWKPEEPTNVAIDLTLHIGWDDGPGSDYFSTMIYTHKALEEARRTTGIKLELPKCIVVHEFDWPEIKASIMNILEKSERPTQESWRELRNRFWWEYEGMAGM